MEDGSTVGKEDFQYLSHAKMEQVCLLYCTGKFYMYTCKNTLWMTMGGFMGGRGHVAWPSSSAFSNV